MKLVIAGGGFGGMNLAKSLAGSKDIDVTLVDSNNYNYFPPLIYQVATSFIEPSNISYPFRKMFQGRNNVRFFHASLQSVDTHQNIIRTDKGNLEYDYLVLATGTETNFFGMENIRQKSLPLKNISDAIAVRNTILSRLEEACKTGDQEEKEKLMTIVIAGGGPTGVEMAGMFAWMNRHIRKKDYPELKENHIRIFLVDASAQLLSAMSAKAQQETFRRLAKMGVEVKLLTAVTGYHNDIVSLSSGESIPAKTLVWVSGVIAREIKGIATSSIGKNRRIIVNEFNQVHGPNNVFAIGDICLQQTDIKFPGGHPQVAQVAIQQGTLLGRNLLRLAKQKPMRPFSYYDKGSMAIISKYHAVADLRVGFFRGFIAWGIWLAIHILPIAGFRNKIWLVCNWCWNFITNDPTLRLIIQPKKENNPVQDHETNGVQYSLSQATTLTPSE